MDKKSKINFKTPSGLKIRLNHRYFFYQLTKTDRYCSEEEIVNNDVMYNATALRKILCKKKSNQTLPVNRADREILLLIALFPEWERGMRASS